MVQVGNYTGVGHIAKPGNVLASGLQPVLSSPPARYERFRAGGAIPTGSAVIIDTAAGNTGISVIVAPTSGAMHAVIGIYTGVGGTGAVTASVAGAGDGGALPSRGDNLAAVAGDLIEICVWGTTQALVLEAAATSPGVGLETDNLTAGVLSISVESITGESQKVNCQSDAATGSTADFYRVFVN